MLIYIILVILFVFIIYNVFSKKRTIEGYGYIKSFRRVPKNNCYENCKQYYDDCMIRYQYVDAWNCKSRFDNCISACNYSDFHKM